MRKLARLLKSTYGERKPVVMRAMPDGLLRGAELDQVVGSGGAAAGGANPVED